MRIRVSLILRSPIKNYFFVDKHVVETSRYIQQDTLLKTFLTNPSNKFFITETTFRPFQERKIILPTFFTLVNSKILKEQRIGSLALLKEIWSKTDEELSSMKNIDDFKEDLFILFEAGYSCYDPGVLPADDFRTPPLIINNSVFYEKFLKSPFTQEILEQTINLCGFEHLIPTVLLEQVIQNSYKIDI